MPKSYKTIIEIGDFVNSLYIFRHFRHLDRSSGFLLNFLSIALAIASNIVEMRPVLRKPFRVLTLVSTDL